MDEFDPITVILQGLRASKFTPAFREYNVGLNTLPFLTEADLSYLGVSNENLRKKILLHGKTRNSNICKDQYLPVTKEYVSEILSATNIHLIKWEANLLTACVRLKRARRPIDPLIESNLYSSQAILMGMSYVEKSLKDLESEICLLENKLNK